MNNLESAIADHNAAESAYFRATVEVENALTPDREALCKPLCDAWVAARVRYADVLEARNA